MHLPSEEDLAENGTKLLPKPIGWERYGYYRIRNHFNCDGLDIDARPLPTMRDWNIYRSLFGTIVDEQTSFNDSVPPTEGYTLNEDGPPPYYAAHGTRGRGLFASRDIQKGDLVHSSKSDVIFPDAMTWRRYVFSLPRRMACDAIVWTWTQRRGIRTCMNIAILMNAANWKTENQTEPNLSASAEMYATRDIKKGEELLYDYKSHDIEWERKVLVCEQYPLLPWSYSPFFICQEGIALAEVMQDVRVLNRVLNYKHKIIVY
jgi:hypothetical protein